MPDLFARLAARAQDLPGATPRVRPRLPHLFERPQPVVPEPEPTAAVPWVPRAEAGRQPAALALDREPPARRGPEPPSPSRRPAAVPEETVVRRRTVTAVESVMSVRRVLERIDLPARPLLLPPMAAPAAPAPPPAPGGGPEPASSPASGRAAVRAATAVRVEPVAAPPRRTPPRAERVVHVTIGRLEVRAGTPAPRPPARPGRPAPAVPLGDYLAGEGGRR